MGQGNPQRGFLPPGMVPGATRRNVILLLLYLFASLLGVTLVAALLGMDVVTTLI
jgi:hypothetical protein